MTERAEFGWKYEHCFQFSGLNQRYSFWLEVVSRRQEFETGVLEFENIDAAYFKVFCGFELHESIEVTVSLARVLFSSSLEVKQTPEESV